MVEIIMWITTIVTVQTESGTIYNVGTDCAAALSYRDNTEIYKLAEQVHKAIKELKYIPEIQLKEGISTTFY
mgnify:CR=1 FL=1